MVFDTVIWLGFLVKLKYLNTQLNEKDMIMISF